MGWGERPALGARGCLHDNPQQETVQPNGIWMLPYTMPCPAGLVYPQYRLDEQVISLKCGKYVASSRAACTCGQQANALHRIGHLLVVPPRIIAIPVQIETDVHRYTHDMVHSTSPDGPLAHAELILALPTYLGKFISPWHTSL